MITIDKEAIQQKLSPLSISGMSDMCKCQNDIFTFPLLELSTIEKNMYFLLRNSVKEKFNPKYKFRPDYLSYDNYGTNILAFMLMFVNGILCIEDFDLDNVLVPDMSSIISICQDNIPKKTIDKMTIVNW